MTTLLDATNEFLSNVSKSKAVQTYEAYRGALLGAHGFLPLIRKSIKYEDDIGKLNEKHGMQYMQDILDLSPATRQLHAAALRRFYTFVAGHDYATVSIDRLNFLFDGSNVLTPVKRQVTYDKVKVRDFLKWVYHWEPNGDTPFRHLRNLRDRAFTLTLAESGLRVHEACKIRIKDLDFDKASGVVIGKGRKQARFKVGDTALAAIRAYLDERQKFVQVMPEQPVFSRHDRRGGTKRIIHMTTQTGEAIIHSLEFQATGEKTITCHTLRHRFVTRVVEQTHNLKLAQELARHTNINVTERYAHLSDDEVDEDFDKVFNPERKQDVQKQ